MKNGLTPIHIQRWAPADYQNDEHVKVLKARRAWTILHFYRQFLDQSFIGGGSLPADREGLAAVVEMPRRDVEKALSYCLNRVIFQDGDRLYQARVRRDVADELTFRAEQSERGKLGGRPKKEATAIYKDKPPLFSSESPPTPSPSPTPAPAPIASACASAAADASTAVVGPVEDERLTLAFLRQEAGTLLRQIGEAGGEDGQAELMRASRTNNGKTIVNLEACSSLSWLRVAVDRLTGRLLELRDPGASAAPLSPRARQRQDSMKASVLGGLKGDGTWPQKPGGKT